MKSARSHYLVTGVAGFIGMHVARHLLEQGHRVTGLDNLNDYYAVSLKAARLAQIQQDYQLHFKELDIADSESVDQLFAENDFDYVIHLAAQAGVRYSLENPRAYARSNLDGFLNILEGCRHAKIKHLVYASSSSVYGGNSKVPFAENDPVDHPVSLYAATKRSNELMAHTYSHLFQIPTTGLRFFTVYGPWGRPDMAPILFARAIMEGEPIKVFNHGKLRRDFTYIDDIVEGVIRITGAIPAANSGQGRAQPSASDAPFRLVNIGNHQPVELEDFINTLASALERPVQKEYLPMQPGDVLQTYADTKSIRELVDFSPATPLKEGISRFVEWFKTYYNYN